MKEVMKVVVQTVIEKEKKQNFKIAATTHNVYITKILERFIDKFIENPQKILEVLK